MDDQRMRLYWRCNRSQRAKACFGSLWSIASPIQSSFIWELYIFVVEYLSSEMLLFFLTLLAIYVPAYLFLYSKPITIYYQEKNDLLQEIVSKCPSLTSSEIYKGVKYVICFIIDSNEIKTWKLLLPNSNYKLVRRFAFSIWYCIPNSTKYFL
jgi:hypothetical protein